jgi:hypothetical protein
MAHGIYQRQQTQHAGSFASDSAVLTVAGQPNLALGIVQNVQLSFAQAIARVHDVGNGGLAGKVPVWYVGGRTQGQATIARILGPASTSLCDFYIKMGDVCNPQDLTFSFTAGCGSQTATGSNSGATSGTSYPGVSANMKYTIQAAVITNVGITVGAQDMLVNENVTFMFANLTCDS